MMDHKNTVSLRKTIKQIYFFPDLSECQLMQIPDAIYLLMQNTQLVKCDLSNNVISKLPVKFTERFPSITGKYISCLDLGRRMKITKLIVLIVSYVDSRVNLCVRLRYYTYYYNGRN